MGDSGGVVNSLDFCPASLKSLGCFYLRCVLSSQWKAVTANFALPTLKTFLEARSQNVSGNKQQLVARAIGCPKTHNFHKVAIFWSAKKNDPKTLIFPPSIPFPSYFSQLQQFWHLYCLAILGSTSIVIHSVKQRLLRNRPGSDAGTSRDFLRERLQRAFTRANQLHCIAQQPTTELPLKEMPRQSILNTPVNNVTKCFRYNVTFQFAPASRTVPSQEVRVRSSPRKCSFTKHFGFVQTTELFPHKYFGFGTGPQNCSPTRISGLAPVYKIVPSQEFRIRTGPQNCSFIRILGSHRSTKLPPHKNFGFAPIHKTFFINNSRSYRSTKPFLYKNFGFAAVHKTVPS